MVKISVIVPIYQVEKYISKTIKSICEQTFTDFEIILVDDGSKDKSFEKAQEVLRNHAVTYKIIRQENKGVSAARNIGIENSSGEFVICIDSDDIIHPNMLAYLINTIDKNDFVITNYKCVSQVDICEYEPASEDFEIYSKEELKNLFLLRKINIIAPGMLLRRSFIEKNALRYNEKIKFSEDLVYIWESIFCCARVGFVKAPLYYYCLRENSTMTASSSDKIYTGYLGIRGLENKLEDVAFVREYIVPRWIVGVLHSSSKILEYEEYRKLAQKMNYKYYLRKLFMFPDMRVRLLTVISFLGLRPLYSIFQKV